MVLAGYWWHMWDKWRRSLTARKLRKLGDAPIVVANGVGPIAETIAYAQRRAAEGTATLIIGVLYDTNTKRWHIGLSRSGADLTWVSAHGSWQQAQIQIDWISYAAAQNDLHDAQTFAAFVQELGMQSEGG